MELWGKFWEWFGGISGYFFGFTTVLFSVHLAYRHYRPAKQWRDIETTASLNTVKDFLESGKLRGCQEDYTFLPVADANGKAALGECEIVVIEDKKQKIRMTYKAPLKDNVLVRKLPGYTPKQPNIFFARRDNR